MNMNRLIVPVADLTGISYSLPPQRRRKRQVAKCIRCRTSAP